MTQVENPRKTGLIARKVPVILSKNNTRGKFGSFDWYTRWVPRSRGKKHEIYNGASRIRTVAGEIKARRPASFSYSLSLSSSQN